MAVTAGTLSEATFDEVIGASDRPVLVEFGAEWCPPCRVLAPILESIVADHSERLALYQVDSDEHPELAGRFSVSSVPTTLVFDNGTLVKRMVGARGRRQLLEELSDVLR
jgi:thioredoxin 1